MLTEAGLFAKALNVESPWFVEKVDFNEGGSRLDIYVDFERGSTFYYKVDFADGRCAQVEFHFPYGSFLCFPEGIDAADLRAYIAVLRP